MARTYIYLLLLWSAGAYGMDIVLNDRTYVTLIAQRLTPLCYKISNQEMPVEVLLPRSNHLKNISKDIKDFVWVNQFFYSIGKALLKNIHEMVEKQKEHFPYKLLKQYAEHRFIDLYKTSFDYFYNNTIYPIIFTLSIKRYSYDGADEDKKYSAEINFEITSNRSLEPSDIYSYWSTNNILKLFKKFVQQMGQKDDQLSAWYNLIKDDELYDKEYVEGREKLNDICGYIDRTTIHFFSIPLFERMIALKNKNSANEEKK